MRWSSYHFLLLAIAIILVCIFVTIDATQEEVGMRIVACCVGLAIGFVGGVGLTAK